MRAQFAKRCAWRAVYLSRSNGRQWAYLGVDPNNGNAPRLFGGLWGWCFRVPLPCYPWRYLPTGKKGQWQRRLYRLSQWFWTGMDGRYGWGTK